MAPMTYAEVRDFVTSRAGAACDGLNLETLLVAALEDMWNRLDDLEPAVSQTVTTVVDTAAYTLTANLFDRVLRVLDENDCAVPAHVASCALFPCSCDGGDTWYTSYKLTGTTTLTFLPTPTEVKTYTVEGLGALSTTLWDMDGSVKVWRTVALPTGLHIAYAEHVLARSMGDTDPGRAQMWLAMANSDFDSWKSRLRRSPGRDFAVAGRYGALSRGNRRDHSYFDYQRWTG